MTTVTRYVCDHCKSVYDTEEEAMQCEQWHKIPSSVQSSGYLPYNYDVKMRGYPSTVVIEFTDGSTASYKKDGSCVQS